MVEYRLSPAAESDLDAIYNYTFEVFGPRQADRYLQDLDNAFQRLATMPELGREADWRPGLLRYRYQSHMVFYTVERDGLMIRRILHARMDFGSRL